MFYLKDGDTRPAFLATLRNGDGTIPDLTGATVVFSMSKGGNRAEEIDGASMSVQDMPTASVVYVWQPQDVDTPGNYKAVIRVTFADGGVATYPNQGSYAIKISAEYE